MTAQQLWETTMDPQEARMIQITLDGCEAAEDALKVCMGEDVAARKEFILQSSQEA